MAAGYAGEEGRKAALRGLKDKEARVVLLALAGLATMAGPILIFRLGLLGLRLVLLLLGLAWAVASLDLWTTDDAFISFRYAANLVDGDEVRELARSLRSEGFLKSRWLALTVTL